MTERVVMVEGKPLRYTLEYKPVKNLNLRVRRDGSVYVSVSRMVAAERVDAFVTSRAAFIRAAQQRRMEQRDEPRRWVSGERVIILGHPYTLMVEPGTPEGGVLENDLLRLMVADTADEAARRRVGEAYWRSLCRESFEPLLARMYTPLAALGVTLPVLRVRDMRSRWGSCIPSKGVVTLSSRLLAAPLPCVEYVALHELCHLLQPDHSPRFHALVERFMPDFKERRALLNAGETAWLAAVPLYLASARAGRRGV